MAATIYNEGLTGLYREIYDLPSLNHVHCEYSQLGHRYEYRREISRKRKHEQKKVKLARKSNQKQFTDQEPIIKTNLKRKNTKRNIKTSDEKTEKQSKPISSNIGVYKPNKN